MAAEAPPVTEVAFLPMPVSTALRDPSIKEGALWATLLSTIKAQEGCLGLRWGRQVEDEGVVCLLIGG